jgi:hypothetical protein
VPGAAARLVQTALARRDPADHPGGHRVTVPGLSYPPA